LLNTESMGRANQWELCRVAIFRVLTILEVLDLGVDLVLGVSDVIARSFPIGPGGIVGGVGVALGRRARGVLHISPGFLRRALDLVGDAFIGEFVVAHSIADLLLGLADCLIKFSGHAILVQGSTSLLFVVRVREAERRIRAAFPRLSDSASDLNDRATAAHQLQYQDNQCDEEQNVDVRAQHMESNETQQPQHQQNNEDCPEHFVSVSLQ
jgi:hypothetical protein